MGAQPDNAEKKLARFANGDPVPKWHPNQKSFADFYSRSRRTVHNWVLEGMPGVRSNHRVSGPESHAWLVENGKLTEPERHDAAGGKSKPSQTELKNRLLELQGRKIAHQLAVAKRQYIAVAEAQKVIGDMIGEAKKVLLAGPSSLAPQVVGVAIAEAEKLLREWLNDALSRLAANPIGTGKTKTEEADK